MTPGRSDADTGGVMAAVKLARRVGYPHKKLHDGGPVVPACTRSVAAEETSAIAGAD
jgi:hypothetical protein